MAEGAEVVGPQIGGGVVLEITTRSEFDWRRSGCSVSAVQGDGCLLTIGESIRLLIICSLNHFDDVSITLILHPFWSDL